MRSRRSTKSILAVVLTVFLLGGFAGSVAAIKQVQGWPDDDADSGFLLGGGSRHIAEPLVPQEPDRDSRMSNETSIWLALRIVREAMKLVWLP